MRRQTLDRIKKIMCFFVVAFCVISVTATAVSADASNTGSGGSAYTGSDSANTGSGGSANTGSNSANTGSGGS